jgi:hypothetical protein
MRLRGLIAMTAASAGLLACAGCSSGTIIGPSQAAGTPNSEAGKDAATIFADSLAAMTKATSAHLKGPIAGILFDADVGKGNFNGTATESGQPFQIVYIADPGGDPTKARIFLKASAAAWTAASSAAAGHCVGDQWLTLDPATAGAAATGATGPAQLTSFAGQLGDLSSFAASLGQSPGTLTKGAVSTINGVSAVEIKGNAGATSVFVAVEGQPDLLRIATTSGGPAQALDFTHWNAGAGFTPPNGARPLTTALAGCPGAATPSASPTP